MGNHCIYETCEYCNNEYCLRCDRSCNCIAEEQKNNLVLINQKNGIDIPDDLRKSIKK